MHIWENLRNSKKPFFVLAPMDDVTDTAFRRLIAETAPPDLYFTEFASVDGLQSPGRSNVMQKLKFTATEQPLIAQLWGLKPENYLKSAQEIATMGFAGIDINMGCPTPVVTRKGACSALINNRELAAEIIAATKEGAGELPVSVKTRIGFKTKVTEDWCGFLLEQDIDALTVHGRTAKEMSRVPNNWDEIGKVATLVRATNSDTVIVGNGDVLTLEHGSELAKQHELDGIMIGRGIFKNPFVFTQNEDAGSEIQRIKMFDRHIDLFIESWGEQKNPSTLKKFAKMYIQGFEGASAIRAEIMSTSTLRQMKDVISRSSKENNHNN